MVHSVDGKLTQSSTPEQALLSQKEERNRFIVQGEAGVTGVWTTVGVLG